MKLKSFRFIHCNQFHFSVYGNDANIGKFKTLKGCANTFQPVDEAASFSHSLIQFLTQLCYILLLIQSKEYWKENSDYSSINDTLRR